jgi:hypothetical protein
MSAFETCSYYACACVIFCTLMSDLSRELWAGEEMKAVSLDPCLHYVAPDL